MAFYGFAEQVEVQKNTVIKSIHASNNAYARPLVHLIRAIAVHEDENNENIDCLIKVMDIMTKSSIIIISQINEHEVDFYYAHTKNLTLVLFEPR